MATMIDKSGATVEVPDDQAQAAFKSGQYGFAEGSRVPVMGESGDIGTVAAEDYDPRLRIASQEEFRGAEQEKKYGGVGGGAAALGINAADALTLGAGKGLAVQAAGLVGGEGAEQATRDYIRGTDVTNPGLAMTGQVLGTAAPLLVGGVEGVVGKGARGIGGAVRGVDTLGSLAETGVRGLVGGEATGALAGAAQKAAAFGARGAVEGSIYGAGNAYSESVLANEDLTAERIMSGAAHGALFGTAIGAGIGGATSLAGSAFAKLGETVIPKIRGAVEDFAEQRAFKAAGGIQKDVRAAMKRAGGAEEISKDLLARGHINYESTADSIAESIAADAEQQGAKLGTMMRELDAKAATAGPGHLVDGSKIVKRAYDEVVVPMLDNPAMRDVGEQMAKRLEPYVADFAGNEIGHAKLWEVRRGLDQRINWETRAQSPLADGLKDFRRILEGELTESADNAARALGVSDTFGKDWKETKRLYSSLAFSRDMAEQGIARKEGNRFFSLTDNLAGGFGAASSGGEASLLGILNPAAALSGVLTAAAHKVLRERGSSILATAADKLSRVGQVAEHAAQIDRKVTDSIDKFLSKGSATAAKVANDNPDKIGAVHAGGVGAAASLYGGSAGHTKEPKGLDGQYHAATKAVATLASQPAVAQEHMQKSVAPMVKHQPAMAMKVASKQTQAITYLQSKIPTQPAAAPGGLSPVHVRAIPDTEKASFLRTLRAVQRPLSALDDLEKGNLSKETVDALKAVYPETYDDLKTKVMNRVASLAADGDDVPYAQKLQIGRLFGVAVDPTQSPAFVAAIGKIFAETGKDIAKPPDQAAPGGAAPGRKVDTAKAIATRSDELEKGLG